MTHCLHDSLRLLLIENNALRNSPNVNHARVVGVFIGLNIWAGFVMSRTLDTDPWLYIATVALFAELVIKTIITLLHYALVVVEIRNTARGEDVDLEVYRRWTNYTENTFDFIFKLFFACCGLWLFIYEYCNPMFAICLVSAGFKISCKILIFLKFMFKEKCITALIDYTIPTAPLDQVRNYADVCAICQSELQGTISLALSCNHIFHRDCLLELFKHQNIESKCPMCQRIVFGEELVQLQLGLQIIQHQKAQHQARILAQQNAQLRALVEQQNVQIRAQLLAL